MNNDSLTRKFVHISRRWKIGITLVIVAVILVLSIVKLNRPSESIMYDLDPDEIGYVICYCNGFGAKKLEYSENQTVIDELCHMISGEYTYVSTWRNTNTDGGGPSTIYFYDTSGNEIEKIKYMNWFICTPAQSDGNYYKYQHIENDLSFTALEEAVSLFGESVN